MVSLTYLSQKHEFKVFIFFLDATGMAQNNSLFIWKISNYSRGRSILRNGMNQVTNLPSLAFTQERIGNLLEVFSEVGLCDIDFHGFFVVAFDPHIFSIVHFVVDRVAKLIVLCNRWLLVFIHQPFCHVYQIYKRLHYLFCGILTIHHSRVMHWQPAVFTVLMN